MDIQDRTLYRIISASVVILIVVGLVSSVNGGSLDITDRELRIIVTDSMDGEPQPYPIGTIPVDSLVVVKHLSADGVRSLQIGDVIQFRYGSVLDHHRVTSVDFEKGWIITKGDNSKGTETVKFDDVTGKVVGVSPILGKAALVAKNYYPMILLLIGIAYVSYLIVKEYRKEKEEKARKASVGGIPPYGFEPYGYPGAGYADDGYGRYPDDPWSPEGKQRKGEI